MQYSHLIIRQFLFLFFISGCFATNAQKNYLLTSPDGKLRAEVMIGTDICFSLKHEGTEVLAPSPVFMKLQGDVVLGDKPRVRKVSTSSVNQVIPSLFYKKSEVEDRYNETVFSFRNNYGLIFRLYDDGLAYRFTTNMKDSIIVMDEGACYQFSKDYTTLVPYVRDSESKPLEEQFISSFENIYTQEALTQLDNKRLIFLPLLVNLDAGKKLCITEADLEDFPGLFLNNVAGKSAFRTLHAPYPKSTFTPNGRDIHVSEREAYIAKTSGARSFPWRVFVVSEEDKELTDNDMVYRLSSSCRLPDISWIKPGKAAWEWWSVANLYGVDFRAGMNNDTYKYFIDFASDNRLEYVILDGGWYDHKKENMMESIPAIDIEELVSYGKAKDVGIILWAGFYPFKKDMEKAIKYYSGLGVKGFKVDFFDRDDQEVVKFLYNAAKLCAENKLILDYHGVFKPAGLMRTYPNVLNFEGVYGQEIVKWTKEPDQVTYDVTIPFIRMVAGPMDYTQGAMRNATRSNYFAVNSEPMSQGTRCRQLAAYVIFESPLTMLCDNPSNYKGEQECLDFIANVPTIWDETVSLEGKVGEYIAMARRKGNDWYIGGMTNWDAREMEIDLSFLNSSNYQLELFKDGINADRVARDFKKEIIDIPANKKIKVKMAPGGGFAARLYCTSNLFSNCP